MRPLHGDRRAGGQHQDHRFAGRVERAQQPVLGRRQADVGPISADEPRIRDAHLLALDVAGEAAHEHHDVRGAGGLERLVERLLRPGQAPAQADLGVADGLEVLETHVVRAAGVQVERCALRARP